MVIAKYRKAEYPGEWFLTDFTMEQVEGRLAALESENARLREALRELMEATESDCQNNCHAPDEICLVCGLGVTANKAREVLGDD